jgi:hypothetical protein
MSYPTLEQIGEALQYHKSSLFDPELREGEILTNGWGIPQALCGGFALTYTINTRRKKYAVRCFHKESQHLEKRYSAISKRLESLRSPYFLDFEFQNPGIKVGSTSFPIVKMEWGRGEILGNFLSARYRDRVSLSNLQTALKTLAVCLEDYGIAHGDIQPENVMVSDDGRSLQLIDYDGMFVEDLLPFGSSEVGHVNFQHPGRNNSTWNYKIDRFSFILLHFALDVLKDNPELWEETKSGSESVLFTANDFINPTKSKIIGKLFNNRKYIDNVRRFAHISKSPFETIPSLADFTEGKNIPVYTPHKVQQKKIEKKEDHTYRSNYHVLDGNNFWLCRNYVGERVEVVGMVASFFESRTKDGRRFVFLNFGDWRSDIFKITIWSNVLPYLLLKPDRSWEGKWVSVIGLMEPYNSEERTHVQINLVDVKGMTLLDEREAMFRLGRREEFEPANGQEKELEFVFLAKDQHTNSVQEINRNIETGVKKTIGPEGKTRNIQDANQKLLAQIKNMKPLVKVVSSTPPPVKGQMQVGGRSSPPVSAQGVKLRSGVWT